MTILSNLDPSVIFGSVAVALLVAFILQGLVLYVYRQDNTLLRSSLAGNIKSMQAERKHHANKIKAIEARVYVMMKGNNLELADPEKGVEIITPDVVVLKSSTTFNRREPQYKNQTDELLQIMSRQEVLKKAADYINTDVSVDRESFVTFEHTLMVVKNGID